MQNNIKKKNILYILNDTAFGGAAQSLLDILVEIRNIVNPIVIIRNDAITVEEKLTGLNIRYYKLFFVVDYVKIGSLTTEKKDFEQIQSYEAALKLLPILKEEKIELIHINSSVSYFGAIAALLIQIPYVWHVRELMEEQFNCESLNMELKKNLYLKASVLITISDYVQKKYKKKYNIDSLRIYNGLSIKRFKESLTGEKEFQDIFLVAAMITPEKRQWDAIQAMEILLKKGYTDIKMLIVGGGSAGYIWALKRYIKKQNLERNIYILPFYNDLSELRKQASYAITCSQNEALGRVTIEAMLAGNIVIGAKSGGTVEIIGVNEERGFLYELGNSQELADIMLKVIHLLPSQKNDILQKAQNYAEKVFNSKGYCDILTDVYNKAIESYIPVSYKEFLNDLEKQYRLLKSKRIYTDLHRISLHKKNADMYGLVLKWLEIKQKGHSIEEYFIQKKMSKIAIYGMGDLGCRLYDELEESKVEVKYLLDKNPNVMGKLFEISSLDGENLDIDIIVVTIVSEEENIMKELKYKGYKKLVRLKEIIDTIYISLNYK